MGDPFLQYCVQLSTFTLLKQTLVVDWTNTHVSRSLHQTRHVRFIILGLLRVPELAELDYLFASHGYRSPIKPHRLVRVPLVASTQLSRLRGLIAIPTKCLSLRRGSYGRPLRRLRLHLLLSSPPTMRFSRCNASVPPWSTPC